MRSDVRECFPDKSNFFISALGRALDGKMITLKHVSEHRAKYLCIPAERNSDRVKTDRKISSGLVRSVVITYGRVGVMEGLL